MNLQPPPRRFLRPQDAETLPGVVVMALVPIELELCVKTPEAVTAVLARLRDEGRTVTPHRLYGTPGWIAKLPDEMGMRYHYGMSRDPTPDWRTVPRDVTVEEAWHWAPLHRGPALYTELCRRAHINPDPNYYAQDRQDRREDIHDHNWLRLDRLVRHFVEGLDMRAFFDTYRRDHPGMSLSAGATFTRAFAQFLECELPRSSIGTTVGALIERITSTSR